jgi:hypothetical protein
VREKHNEGFPIMWEVIRTKVLELSHEMPTAANNGKFKASTGWCVHMMRWAGLALQCRTTLVQRLPGEYSQKLLEFQWHVIKLRKQHPYILGHIGNANQTPVYFDMPSNVTVNEKGAKPVLIRGTGNEKARITVLLDVLTDGHKLLPYVILRRRTMPKEKLPVGLVFWC